METFERIFNLVASLITALGGSLSILTFVRNRRRRSVKESLNDDSIVTTAQSSADIESAQHEVSAAPEDGVVEDNWSFNFENLDGADEVMSTSNSLDLDDAALIDLPAGVELPMDDSALELDDSLGASLDVPGVADALMAARAAVKNLSDNPYQRLTKIWDYLRTTCIIFNGLFWYFAVFSEEVFDSFLGLVPAGMIAGPIELAVGFICASCLFILTPIILCGDFLGMLLPSSRDHFRRKSQLIYTGFLLVELVLPCFASLFFG